MIKNNICRHVLTHTDMENFGQKVLVNLTFVRRQVLGSGCEEPSSEWREDLRPLHKPLGSDGQ